MVETEVPLAVTGPLPLMLEFPLTGDPAVKTRVPPARPATLAGETQVKVLISAWVELRVQIDIPVKLFDREQAPITFVLPVSVALNVGVTAGKTAFPFASFKVTVIVALVEPFATIGPLPLRVEVVGEAALPPVKTTVPPVTLTGEVIERVLVSARVDFKVQSETPLALDAEQRVAVLAPPVSVALKVGIVPAAIGLP